LKHLKLGAKSIMIISASDLERIRADGHVTIGAKAAVIVAPSDEAGFLAKVEETIAAIVGPGKTVRMG
jgi:hypothetical protein